MNWTFNKICTRSIKASWLFLHKYVPCSQTISVTSEVIYEKLPLHPKLCYKRVQFVSLSIKIAYNLWAVVNWILFIYISCGVISWHTTLSFLLSFEINYLIRHLLVRFWLSLIGLKLRSKRKQSKNTHPISLLKKLCIHYKLLLCNGHIITH